MTESDWRNSTDPQKMLEFLRGKASDRKLRLFAVACCRRIWDFITCEESRRAVEITERFADGPVLAAELATIDFDSISDDCGPPEEPYRTAYMVAGNVGYNVFGHCESAPLFEEFHIAERTAVGAAMSAGLSLSPERAYSGEASEAYRVGEETERAAQAALLRDIFGNPFRPVSIEPASLIWNDGTVQKVAQAIYNDRRFDDLPILADGLEEAGCTNVDILAHCRGAGPHVRGCWVVDLILGKE
jgi:hypothetical protein